MHLSNKILLILLLIPLTLVAWCASRPFLAKPSPWARKTVRDIDYRTLEFVFRTKPLPKSLKITGVDYKGYSTIMIGPDGPAYSDYEITVDAKDFDQISKGFEEDVTSREESRSVWSAVRAFGSDLWDYNFDSEYSEPEEKELSFFQLETKNASEYSPKSYMVVDERTSPTLKLYLNTRAYLYLPENGESE